VFCKPADGTVTSLKVFNVMTHFLEESEIKWENCTGFYTDRTKSISG